MLTAGDTKLEEAIEQVGALYMKANTEAEFEKMMKSLGIEEEMKSAARMVVGC